MLVAPSVKTRVNLSKTYKAKQFQKNNTIEFVQTKKPLILTSRNNVLLLSCYTNTFLFILEKRATTSHGFYFNPKDNSQNMREKQVTEKRERLMKTSHFNIGSPNTAMLDVKPINPIEP